MKISKVKEGYKVAFEASIKLPKIKISGLDLPVIVDAILASVIVGTKKDADKVIKRLKEIKNG